jgi:hypothetical protein
MDETRRFEPAGAVRSGFERHLLALGKNFMMALAPMPFGWASKLTIFILVFCFG